jgi:secondary thiamine-phosphate synthase enzyme
MLIHERLQTAARIGFLDITTLVAKAIKKSGVRDGIAVVYCPHTTAGITINENADPDVASDIERKLSQLIPVSGGYSHAEGNADAHIKSSLIGASQTVLVEKGKPVLGTWQGVYFCEFDGPRHRSVNIKVMGNPEAGRS